MIDPYKHLQQLGREQREREEKEKQNQHIDSQQYRSQLLREQREREEKEKQNQHIGSQQHCSQLLREQREREEKQRNEERNRTSADEWYKKGDVFVDQGQSEEAITCYKKSLELGAQKFITRKSDANNINKADTNGLTALHHAAKSGYPEIVKHLLDNQADILALTNDGLTAYDLAIAANQIQVINILKENNVMKSLLQQIGELKNKTDDQHLQIDDLKQKLNNETQLRLQKDVDLNDKITFEKNQLSKSIVNLNQAVINETQSRDNIVDILRNNINRLEREKTVLENTVNTQKNKLDQETQTRSTRNIELTSEIEDINSKLSNHKQKLDSQEQILALEARTRLQKDNELNDKIGLVQTQASGVSNFLTFEQERVNEELNKVTKSIQKETTERKQNLEQLQNQIDKQAVSGGNSLESAVDRKDLPEVEKLISNASNDLLKGLNLISITHLLKPEKIPQSSISSIKQLFEATNSALKQPNDKKYLKLLAKGINKTLDLWRNGKLENKEAVQSLDQDAMETFMQLLQQGKMSTKLDDGDGGLLKSKLDADRKQLWNKWYKKELPKEQTEKLDAHITQRIWESWVELKKEDNLLATTLENYESKILLDGVMKKDLPKEFAGYQEQITKAVSGKLLLAIKNSSIAKQLNKALNPIVKKIQGDDIIWDMTPIFEKAITELLSQSSQGKLSNETMQALQEIFNQVTKEQKIDGKLKCHLRQQAAKNLVADYKDGKLAGLVEPVMQAKTNLIINKIKHSDEEKQTGIKQVLEDLKQGKINPQQADELFIQLTEKWQGKLKEINEITNPIARIIKLEEKMKDQVVKKSDSIKSNPSQNPTATFGNNIPKTSEQKMDKNEKSVGKDDEKKTPENNIVSTKKL